MFNSVYYNPGFAGIDGLTRATVIARQQYLGYQPTLDKGGAPQSFVLTGSTLTPLLNKSIGVGINFLYDKLGPLTTTQAQISASYLYRFKTSTIGFGFRAGIVGQRLGSDYRVNDDNDYIYQQLKAGAPAQVKPDLTLGVVYRSPKFYIGVSMSHIIKTEYSYGLIVDSIKSKLKNHMYVTGAYNFDLGTLIQLTPSFIVQTDMRQLTYLFGAIATYNDKFWFGINARESFAKKEVNNGGKTLSNDDIVFLVGVNLMKNKQNINALRIGYAFDFVTSGVNAKSNTSHEILLSYVVIPPWEILKPKIRTPRYRHDEN
jgi:type IX secretion system PorP/SprF family membrane protein